MNRLSHALHSFLLSCACLAAAGAAQPGAAAPPDHASVVAGLTPDGGRIVVEARGLPAPAPLFFSATVDQTVRLGAARIEGEMRLRIHVLQGRPEILTLGLAGNGEVTDVSGPGLRDWSVRQAAGGAGGARLLDLRPVLDAGSEVRDLDLLVRTLILKPAVPGPVALLVAGRGNAVGFASTLTLVADPDIDFRVTSLAGLEPLGDKAEPAGTRHFASVGDGRIELRLLQRGAASADAELVGTQLVGRILPTGASVDFRLRGELRAARPGSRLSLLSGRAALSGPAAGDGWHVELVPAEGGRFAYDLVADRAGVVAIDLSFAAEVRDRGDWRSLQFVMPAGAVVPVQLEGLGSEITFKPDSPITPTPSQGGWRGFMPADGRASLSWKTARAAAQGALVFTSTEQSDVRIGSGLLSESSRITLRVLQGGLGSVRCRLEGSGEILGVEGTNVVGWKVVPDGAARVLEISFSRPLEAEGSLTVSSQAELGAFPARAEPMRLVPLGVIRHSGFVRIANRGSVRLEVADATGMMQLSPEQFPGPAAEAGARQVFVYRFPAAEYRYRVVATEIQPEVAVSEVATYELSETDRVISASLELDVREAALREWSVQIPADYTVAAVEGSGVSDYSAETSSAGGFRTLKVQFAQPVEGRELLQLRLERNQPAGAGDWRLAPLRFPGAKSVRGDIGAVSTPGFRIVPAAVDGLAEVPLSYFPRQTAGLQQAWRLRGSEWSAQLRIEALGQSVQADVFHLYTVKEGVVYASVLVNYFVVGAPATEWRLELPPSVGNIDVTGQSVQRDWRREGNQVVVTLHQPVLGGSTLLLTFEQPMSARGGVIDPGQVRPLGVQGERGYIEVVSPLQVKFDVRRAEGGLLKLDPLELPAEFRLMSGAPALAAYQYTARPFRLEMGLDWYAPADTADQVVDFAQLSSRVSRDGQVVTDARYFVKTRGRSSLRLVLPRGVRLWETRVDNEAVAAQVDGEQTLIPLPARANPNEPVCVALRLGQAAGAGEAAELRAPRTLVPTVLTDWTLRGDPGLQLVPEGGTAQLVRPVLTESGFEWISGRGALAAASLLGLVALGALLLLSVSPGRLAAGLACGGAALLFAAMLSAEALHHRRPNLRELSYASTLVSPAETLSVRVAAVRPWRAMIVGWGVASVLGGAGLAAAAAVPPVRRRRGARLLAPAASVLLSAGLLAQHGGAALFFGATALAVFLRMFVPGVARWQVARRAHALTPPAGRGAPAVASLLLVLGLGGVASPARAQAEPPATAWLQDGLKAAQSMAQTWTIRNHRLFGEVDLTVRGEPGESFLLLAPPAVLTGFAGEGLRVSKVERDGKTSYYVAPERAGTLAAHARFEMPVAEAAREILVPTGPAALQRIALELDQGGWEFTSPMAVQVLPTPGLGEGRSGATLLLAPRGQARIRLRPRGRDAAAEATQFYAEAANLYVPGPGVVDGFARISIRPVQGRVSAIDIDVPIGLTVGDVVRGPVGAWRFDPGQHRLHVAIEPAQTGAFGFEVVTQMGAGALPFDLVLEPLAVEHAAGQVGTLALAFGPEAQPEAIVTSGITPLNLQDFDQGLVPRTQGDQPLAVLERVWRYGQAAGRVAMKVVAVAPEVRVSARQVLSIDDERMLMAVDLGVSITRAGIFKLSFALPDGLDLEALSGPSLSQWTEADERGQRIITLHLNGRTIGEEAFALTLAGAAPRPQAAWSVPRLLVREASRQTGEALLVPGKGLRLRVAERAGVTQIDPRSAGGIQPGTLAFRLLQADWALRVGVEALDPWVTVQSLEEVTVREGQTLTRVALHLRVENAAIRQLAVRLPGLGEDRARTVRATGSALSDMVMVPGSPDAWQIHFQRAVAGDTDVLIEFSGAAARGAEGESVLPPEFPGARQVTGFVSIRGSGRLELDAGSLPRGWARADWSAVPANLQSRSDRTVPALCFRVAQPEGPLAVRVRRHDIADALKLRVTRGELTTVFSPGGSSLTSVELRVDVLEKSTLRVRLPAGARLFSTLVNGESASVVREADAYLFHVAPNTDADPSAAVRLVYSAPGTGGSPVGLVAPGLSVPLENVTWRVLLPDGYRLRRYRGDLQLHDEHAAGGFGIGQYQELVDSRRAADAEKGISLLQQADSFLQSGDQQRAGVMLGRASNAQLDEASNEDARVQLRNLRTQQMLLGLNTRRQRLYLDNRGEAARNEQLEQAASLNPFMRGKMNFDPQQVDQLLMGNTAEETAALRGIAGRLVDQQLAAEPAPGAIDVTLPLRGRVLTFTRSLQVDGEAPLGLRLVLGKSPGGDVTFSLLVLLAVAALAALSAPRLPEKSGAPGDP